MTTTVRPTTLAAAQGKLHARTRRAVIESYRRTWESTGGVVYRKRPSDLAEDKAQARLLCRVLADDLAYETKFGWDTPDAIWSEIQDEALRSGVIKNEPGLGLFHNQDRGHLTATVKSRP